MHSLPQQNNIKIESLRAKKKSLPFQNHLIFKTSYKNGSVILEHKMGGVQGKGELYAILGFKFRLWSIADQNLILPFYPWHSCSKTQITENTLLKVRYCSQLRKHWLWCAPFPDLECSSTCFERQKYTSSPPFSVWRLLIPFRELG